SGETVFEDGSRTSADTVIATDGAGSAVRKSMEASVEGFKSSERFLEHGYKELHIPPINEMKNPPAHAGGSDLWAIENNALHIWPRHQFMMIALPNFDGSFTCTLFLAQRSSPPYEGGLSGDEVVLSGSPAFDLLTDKNSLLEFFSREFPDAVRLMPTLVQ